MPQRARCAPNADAFGLPLNDPRQSLAGIYTTLLSVIPLTPFLCQFTAFFQMAKEWRQKKMSPLDDVFILQRAAFASALMVGNKSATKHSKPGTTPSPESLSVARRRWLEPS